MDGSTSYAGGIIKIITQTGYKPSNYDVDIAVGKPSFAKRQFYSNAPATDKFNDALQFTAGALIDHVSYK